MSCTRRALVRPQQPSFQQRSYPVDTWHHDLGWFWTGRQDGILTNIAPIGEIIVPFPVVGVHKRAWLNAPPHELHEAFRADIGDASESNSPDPIVMWISTAMTTIAFFSLCLPYAPSSRPPT